VPRHALFLHYYPGRIALVPFHDMATWSTKSVAMISCEGIYVNTQWPKSHIISLAILFSLIYFNNASISAMTSQMRGSATEDFLRLRRVGMTDLAAIFNSCRGILRAVPKATSPLNFASRSALVSSMIYCYRDTASQYLDNWL
jgi:hypothetical protein